MNEHYLHTITHTHLCFVCFHVIFYSVFVLFWGQKCVQQLCCCCCCCVRLFMCNINLKSIRCDNDQIKNSISFNLKRIAIFEWILSFGVRFVCITSFCCSCLPIFISISFFAGIYVLLHTYRPCISYYVCTGCSPVCLLKMCTLRYAVWILPSVYVQYEERRRRKRKRAERSWACDSCLSSQCSEQVNVAVCMNFTCTPKRKKEKYKWIETSFLFSNVKYQQRKRRRKKLNSFNFSPMICGVLTFRLAIKPTLLSFSLSVCVCLIQHTHW